MSNLVECQTSNLSNLTPNDYVKPVNKSLTMNENVKPQNEICQTSLEVSNLIDVKPINEATKSLKVDENVKPKQLTEVEKYKQLVYQRANTRDHKRYYTFS